MPRSCKASPTSRSAAAAAAASPPPPAACVCMHGPACRVLLRPTSQLCSPGARCRFAADILLSWDYWQLEREMAEGGGPIAELPTIPRQFASVEVGTPGGGGGSGWG